MVLHISFVVSLSLAECTLPIGKILVKQILVQSKLQPLAEILYESILLVYSRLWTEYGEPCVKHLRWNGLQKQLTACTS